jgi:N-acyl-phosphatidylethanolamine-hydrolysing phospholipase D
MHWGTFILTDEPILEPPQKVKAAMKDAGLNEDDFLAVKHGELQIFSKEEKQTQPQKKEKKKEKPDDE